MQDHDSVNSTALDFGSMFKKACGFRPYAYQCRLACGNDAHPDNSETLRRGVDCCSRLIDIPTGSGKTAAVVLAWLWNCIIHPNAEQLWPRRLVYCLPMRTLVEQTQENVRKWLTNLLAAADTLSLSNDARKHLTWIGTHSPVILMGGQDVTDWDLYPERPAILIGTQDMLLSRALNRGYGMSRYRWPMHFGLLNNDCLWVMDELQLMGPGIATACQLEAFRCAATNGARPRGLASFFNSRSATWYASATTSSGALETREWRDVQRPADFRCSLTDIEKTDTTSSLGRRRFALKRLETHRDWHFGQKYPPAERIFEIIVRHGEMAANLKEFTAPVEVACRSLIICNTVDRAIAVFEELYQKQGKGELVGIDLLLLHSRFRLQDRKTQIDKLKPEYLQNYPNGQIVVSTQVIEAGVDISSGIFWIEIAPLASLVQRLGRLNRSGEFGANGTPAYGWAPVASIIGLDLPEIPEKPQKAREDAEKTARKCHLPYEQRLCEDAWQALTKLNGDASPAALETIRDAIADSIDRCPYSLQRHELLDFFDTDSNLSLGYTDVSPFVRGLDNDTDVYVLWREWNGSDKGVLPPFFSEIQREEVCAVPIGKLKANLDVWSKGWLWLGRERGWASASGQGIWPGATLLLPVSAGGYISNRGWTGDAKDTPESFYQPADQSSDEDALSFLSNGWRSIPDHTNDVRAALSAILQDLPSELFFDEVKNVWCETVDWHDIGKNHKVWQEAVTEALKAAEIDAHSDHLPLAKFSLSDSPKLRDQQGNLLTSVELRREIYSLKRSFRPGIAHEVASALALRQWHIQTASHVRSLAPATKDAYLSQLLAEYLVMSHHGRVRKVLRDEIPRKAPREAKSAETVRGVRECDVVSVVTINGQDLGCEALSVNCRQIGRDTNGHESYTRSVLRLLDHCGPFRLAYLEMIFRAADGRASKEMHESAREQTCITKKEAKP